jgi:hypothetical protein
LIYFFFPAGLDLPDLEARAGFTAAVESDKVLCLA